MRTRPRKTKKYFIVTDSYFSAHNDKCLRWNVILNKYLYEGNIDKPKSVVEWHLPHHRCLIWLYEHWRMKQFLAFYYCKKKKNYIKTVCQ